MPRLKPLILSDVSSGFGWAQNRGVGRAQGARGGPRWLAARVGRPMAQRGPRTRVLCYAGNIFLYPAISASEPS